MNEIERLNDQLRRAHEGNAWHGPSVREALRGLTAASTSMYPVQGAHSIRELVVHIITWRKFARLWLDEPATDVSPEEDWKPVTDESETAWAKVLRDLDASHRDLYDRVSLLTEADLDRPVPGRDYTVHMLLHGVIQHDVYHAGQIALLRKITG